METQIDCGVFDPSAERQLIQLKNVEAPEAFAITVEQHGGAVSPTLETMLVLGNV